MLDLSLSFAQSLDGCIATKSGESQWISCHETLVFAHELRRDHDAIMVGSGTVKIDNPQLSARLAQNITRQPTRVILDSNLSTGTEARVYQDQDRQKTLVFASHFAANDSAKRKVFDDGGVEVIGVGTNETGLDLKEVMEKLEKRGINSLFVEGGSGLITTIVKQNLFMRLYLVIAPILLGEGKKALGELAIDKLTDAPRYLIESSRIMGSDLVLKLIPR